jgi:hypothetical protein
MTLFFCPKSILFAFPLLFLTLQAKGQQDSSGLEKLPDPHFPFATRNYEKTVYFDTLEEKTLQDALKKGQFEIKFRNFFMATLNQGDLLDSYANGIGAGMHYKSRPWKGFHAGLGGFFIFNLFSSDMQAREERAGNAPNRYEIGLFDVENPKNKTDLDRLEELYVAYDYKSFSAQVGRLVLNTPYINPQDGRMRPTVQEGLLLKFAPVRLKIELEAAYLWGISPRSTVRFAPVGHTIGLYPQGVRTDGKRNDYLGHQHSKGIFYGDLKYKPLKGLELRLFNQYVENIFNTALFQIEYLPKKKNGTAPIFGFQYHLQNKVGNGGNPDPELAYYEGQQKAQVLSSRIGLAYQNHTLMLNYSHITDDGRFLAPREWGRDPFYTFLPRERNEGLGGVHAATVNYRSVWWDKKFIFSVGYGYYQLPDVRNFRLNKYGMPSYHQLNLDLRYKFHKFLQGLESQLLIVHKRNAGETYQDLRFVFNKVNMTNFNFVLNYHFGS